MIPLVECVYYSWVDIESERRKGKIVCVLWLAFVSRVVRFGGCEQCKAIPIAVLIQLWFSRQFGGTNFGDCDYIWTEILDGDSFIKYAIFSFNLNEKLIDLSALFCGNMKLSLYSIWNAYKFRRLEKASNTWEKMDAVQ